MVRELDRLRSVLMRCVVFVIVPLFLAALTFFTPLGIVMLAAIGEATGWFRIEDYMSNPT